MRVAHPDGTELERTFLTHYRQLCGGCGMPKMHREYKFLPDREFRFDFAWPSARVAVECEGYDHMKTATYHKDITKYNLAAAHGWAVLRFTRRLLNKEPQHCIGLLVATVERRGGKES